MNNKKIEEKRRGGGNVNIYDISPNLSIFNPKLKTNKRKM